MKKYIILAITALCLQYMQAQTIVPPSVKTKTTFAIVVDKKSYDEAKNEIHAYRASVEKEGLGTYLLVDDWKRPEPIRAQLIKWHNNKKAPLEGCVFIGDIPIPMIRDAHHLTSAFKMSPKADCPASKPMNPGSTEPSTWPQIPLIQRPPTSSLPATMMSQVDVPMIRVSIPGATDAPTAPIWASSAPTATAIPWGSPSLSAHSAVSSPALVSLV